MFMSCSSGETPAAAPEQPSGRWEAGAAAAQGTSITRAPSLPRLSGCLLLFTAQCWLLYAALTVTRKLQLNSACEKVEQREAGQFAEGNWYWSLPLWARVEPGSGNWK